MGVRNKATCIHWPKQNKLVSYVVVVALVSNVSFVTHTGFNSYAATFHFTDTSYNTSYSLRLLPPLTILRPR